MKRLGILGLGILSSGCARQAVLDPAGDQAFALHGLLNLTLVVCGVAYLLVLAFLGAALWRARRRLEAVAGTQPDDRRLSLSLAAWAGLITLGLLVIAGASFMVDRALAAHDAAAADIRV